MFLNLYNENSNTRDPNNLSGWVPSIGKLLDNEEGFLTYEVLYVQNKTNQYFKYNNLWSVIDVVR